MSTTIFSARKIITMNPSKPLATHVAVRDGRILGAGSLDELRGWGPHVLDARFADKVLMPGFVEAHAHLMAGALWRYAYCGYFDVNDPDGRNWPGAGALDAVVARLAKVAEAKAEGPIVGWGLDPIYYGTERLTRVHLDRVSDTRMVGVMHASLYIGATLVLMPRWDRDVAGHLISAHQVTHWTNIPTMVIDLLGSAHLERYDLSSLVHIGGQQVPWLMV